MMTKDNPGRISHRCHCREMGNELAIKTAECDQLRREWYKLNDECCTLRTRVAGVENQVAKHKLTIANFEILAAACHNQLILPVQMELDETRKELARIEQELEAYPLLPQETFIGRDGPADKVTWLVRRLTMVEKARLD